MSRIITLSVEDAAKAFNFPEEFLEPRIVSRFKRGDYTYLNNHEYRITKGFIWKNPILTISDEYGEISVSSKSLSCSYDYAVRVWINKYPYPYEAYDILSDHEIKLWADFCTGPMEQEGFHVVNKGEYEAVFDANQHQNDHVYVQYIHDIWKPDNITSGCNKCQRYHVDIPEEKIDKLVQKYFAAE